MHSTSIGTIKFQTKFRLGAISVHKIDWHTRITKISVKGKFTSTHARPQIAVAYLLNVGEDKVVAVYLCIVDWVIG